MPIRSQENVIGAWAFLIGVILAVILGLVTSQFFSVPGLIKYSAAIYGLLVILGVVIGFMITTGKDSQTFLLAGAVLVVVSGFGSESVKGSLIGIGLGEVVNSIFGALLALLVPATIVVALKTLFGVARV